MKVLNKQNNRPRQEFLFQPEPGAAVVGIVDSLRLTDKSRDRQLDIRVYYPQEQGLFPVIIFSHGGGGSKEAFSYLGRFWASHGYISIHPAHHDKALFRDVDSPEELQDRPQDLSFLIDSLTEIERQIPQLDIKIKQSCVGVAGHSLGAYTTMLLAGMSVNFPQYCTLNFREPRASAFLAISPLGTGKGGLDRHSWDKITAPLMTVSGTRERGESWRMEPFQHMPSSDKYHVLIKGAYHSSYNDSKGDEEQLLLNHRQSKQKQEWPAYIYACLQVTSLFFWDAYLKGNKPAKDYLKSAALQACSHDQVLVFMK